MLVEFNELLGKTLVKIENKNNEELIFTTDQNEVFALFHNQDCCENVEIQDICGDLDDLIGTPLVMAGEINHEAYITPDEVSAVENQYSESFTWTFYKIGSNRGDVTIRWYGSSNGYYSESVDFCKKK